MDQCSRHDTPSVLQAALTNQPGHALSPEINVPGEESAHRPAGSEPSPIRPGRLPLGGRSASRGDQADPVADPGAGLAGSGSGSVAAPTEANHAVVIDLPAERIGDPLGRAGPERQAEGLDVTNQVGDSGRPAGSQRPEVVAQQVAKVSPDDVASRGGGVRSKALDGIVGRIHQPIITTPTDMLSLGSAGQKGAPDRIAGGGRRTPRALQMPPAVAQLSPAAQRLSGRIHEKSLQHWRGRDLGLRPRGAGSTSAPGPG